ncbi:SDR family oxidoreductase [Solirubrobacter phytolaccae]|uniref:SDR family oxidoreductase n=1 Tax=Solirubrobacter phytolaccae TaxID=1404360 RepID=A0A9X3NI27_9ACTN|nr:SDR family oxidoreductase [Solirubrobacter phytolaccae]MDA0181602.1 SDR family oxidoreductase [Solirubrobacter phytolaccae]
MTNYFVTGATGFIGRHLVERLLEREGDIYVLVREGSREKLATLVEGWGQADRIKPVLGDLALPNLGVETELPKIDHFFHLAAIYDMSADEASNTQINVGGTQHAVDLANRLDVGRFHHISSIAVAGLYDDGTFNEDMFDEGQKLAHPYHRTKFESERLVRERVKSPLRIYRPSIVVGNSKTGEMDKIDGPYYFFKLLQKVRHALPEWFPLISLEWGWTNIVPVDYVAAAIDHIAHKEDLESNTFHIVDPKGQRVGEVLNTFAEAGHAPRAVMRIDRRALQNLPKGVLSFALKLPALKQIRGNLLADLGIPDEVVEYIALTCRFDSRDAQRALRDSTITVPSLPTYAHKLWDYWERVLDPDLYKDHSFEGAVNGKTVIITGASSGIGRAAALKIAAAGGVPILVARTLEKLEEVKAEIEAAGGTAYVAPCDLSDFEAIEDLVEKLLADHPRIDMLVNNAGRSIRRSVALSYDRFHDYERTVHLNYLSPVKLMLGLLPHMRDQGGGHIVNVSSIGVQTSPPRFSAYVASKSALDAFTRVVSSETIGDNVTFTTIHMPLVRTPMIAPTKMYDSFPTISPEEAADLVCEAIRAKPKQINTKLGTFGEVAYALAPKAVDQILHLAYRVFPESTAAKGGGKDGGEGGDKASGEATALAYLMRGVHW